MAVTAVVGRTRQDSGFDIFQSLTGLQEPAGAGRSGRKQIQSLESYQLDDLPAVEKEGVSVIVLRKWV
jgi:hypothetical protein